MAQQNNNNKTKLLIFMLLAIIILLVAGIVYQFVVIKRLEKQQNANAIISVVNEENSKMLNYKNFL